MFGTITTTSNSATTNATPKPGTCPAMGLYSPFCASCTVDTDCLGIQKCCPAGFSGRNCCFAVYLGPKL
uniref:WAP domain-containing protein n=1 Tax=Strigamia maritima TaxID=126957 RepID=T1J305_STRMM